LKGVGIKNQGGERERKISPTPKRRSVDTRTNLNGGDANMIQTSPLKLVFGRLATPHMLMSVTHTLATLL